MFEKGDVRALFFHIRTITHYQS